MNNQHNNDMILFDYNQNSTNANFLDNLHIPNIVKVVGVDGNKEIIDNQCVDDIKAAIGQIVTKHEYSCVDYNDVAAILQSGENALAVIVEAQGNDRAEMAAAELIERIEAAGCQFDTIKGILLHIHFTTSPFRLTVKEYGTITGSLWQRLDSCANLLCGVSDGCNADSNLLRITALVIS